MTASTSSSSSGGDGSSGSGPKGEAVYRGEADAQAIIDAIERARHPEDVDELGRGEYHKSLLPMGRLPGFGEPDDDCGEYLVEASRACPCCYNVSQHKHVCNRYDCPQHAPNAIRRRAAGSKDAAGVAPKLDAIRRFLNYHRADNQYFHHLTINLLADFILESDDPLERAFDMVREIMDELGIQGIVVYHPFKGDHVEDPEVDDRGKWKQRLFHDRDWHDDVRGELRYAPHFHIIGVAPHVDVGVTEAVEAETGVVINRREDEDTNISIPDDLAMARAVLYSLSHAYVYTTDKGQRRLAARYKGPDVDHVTPFEDNKVRMQAIVYQAAEQTLGVAKADLECDGPNIVDIEVQSHYDPVIRHGAVRSIASPATTISPPGPHVAGVGGMPSSPIDLPDRDLDPPRATSSTSTSSATSRVTADVGDEERVTCGTPTVHISQAGGLLLDGERREFAPKGNVEDLERAYRSYIDVMKAKNADPLENPMPAIPEFRDDVDGPPPD